MEIYISRLIDKLSCVRHGDISVSRLIDKLSCVRHGDIYIYLD